MGLTGHIRRAFVLGFCLSDHGFPQSNFIFELNLPGLLFYMLCAIRIGHAAAEFQPFRPSALLSTGSAAGRVPELTSA